MSPLRVRKLLADVAMLPNVRLSRSSGAAVLIIAGAVFGASPALAAPPKGKPQPAPAPAPTPAPADHAPPTSESLQNARLHFVAGVNLLRDPAKPRYEEAYREFKTAYALSPA